MDRLAELRNAYPEIHPSIIVKADVLREGVRKTPLLAEIAQWAMHDPHWLFDWHHDGPYTKEDADSVGMFQPELFQLEDDTTVKLIIDQASPYEICRSNGGYALLRNGKEVYPVFFPKKPKWYSLKTSDGVTMSSIAALKGIDTFACCILNYCEYFKDKEECKYCNMNYNIANQRDLGVDKKIGKAARQLGEAAAAAFKEGNVRHVTITGGALKNRAKECDLYIGVVEEIRRQTGHQHDVLWGEVISQAFEPEDAVRLKKAGIQAVCWNLEVWDPRLFGIIAPGKALTVGRDNWLRCLQAAVGIFGRGNVCSSFVSGSEMAQPYGFKTVDDALESTIAGFDWLLQRDIVPRFNMWSNVVGSQFTDQVIPPTEYWLRLGQARHDLMLKYEMYPHATCNCYKDIHRSVFPDFYHLMT
jgi:hypothetical protein